jgi:6-phosphogluconolactonase/glucosamine-6-phosphate isomerase/deaminase
MQQVQAGLEALSEEARLRMQVDKWVVLFADERSVPNDHEDSNYMNSKAVLDAVSTLG